jgi:hypothetical protein
MAESRAAGEGRHYRRAGAAGDILFMSNQKRDNRL